MRNLTGRTVSLWFYFEGFDSRSLFLILHNLTATEPGSMWLVPSICLLLLFPGSLFLPLPGSYLSSQRPWTEWASVWAEGAVMCEMMLRRHTHSRRIGSLKPRKLKHNTFKSAYVLCQVSEDKRLLMTDPFCGSFPEGSGLSALPFSQQLTYFC